MAVEMRFVMPDSGNSVNIDLSKDSSNFMIRAKYYIDDKRMTANAKINNDWLPGGGTTGHYDGNLTRGDEVDFKLEAQEEDWVVYLGGKEVCRYKHQCPVKDVEKMLFYPRDAKRISYSVHCR